MTNIDCQIIVFTQTIILTPQSLVNINFRVPVRQTGNTAFIFTFRIYLSTVSKTLPLFRLMRRANEDPLLTF